MDLLLYGAQVHKHTHKWREVQQCTLLSIKTGGCSEDCSYCPQSSRYDTGVKAQKLLSEDIVLEAAKKAKEAGSSRSCMAQQSFSSAIAQQFLIDFEKQMNFK